MKKFIFVVCVLFAFARGAQSIDVPSVDYLLLTQDILPHPQELIEDVLQQLQYDEKTYGEWKWEARLSQLLPQVFVGWDRYNNVVPETGAYLGRHEEQYTRDSQGYFYNDFERDYIWYGNLPNQYNDRDRFTLSVTWDTG